MQREAPDSDFYREIRDFNLEFLGLVAAARGAGHGGAFGLERAVVEAIGRMQLPQLEAMASTPCLLATLVHERTLSRHARVAEPQPSCDPAWADEVRVFTARLMTYAWQMARRDSLRATLCIGAAADTLSPRLTYAELRLAAHHDLRQVRARFHDHPRFWPDLVRVAAASGGDELRLAQLAAIPLATSELAAIARQRLA